MMKTLRFLSPIVAVALVACGSKTSSSRGTFGNSDDGNGGSGGSVSGGTGGSGTILGGGNGSGGASGSSGGNGVLDRDAACLVDARAGEQVPIDLYFEV